MPRPLLFRRDASITRRLILSLTLGTVVMWCLGVSYASYATYQELNAAFDQVLRQTALRILPLAADDALGREADDVRDIDRMMDTHAVNLGYELTDSRGKVLLRERDSPDLPFLRGQPNGFSSRKGFRVYRLTDPATLLTITVVESMQDRQYALYESIRAMMLPLVPLVLLNILLIWLVVRGAMRPIDRLRGDIAERDSRNLAPLDQQGQPSELRPIADAVARLMERLRHALDAERAFSANSAHELRTPIAGALAQTQRLLAATRDPEVKTRAREIESALKRLSRLSEKLLQLARADAGLGAGETQLDLKPILDIVVRDTASHWNADERIRYDPAAGPALPARLDPDAFAIMVRNLLDNALAHGPEGGEVTVTVDPGRVLRIVNGGPALPRDQLDALTHRFVRGGTKAVGSGLGLAIVRTIAEHCGCHLVLTSPAPGRTDGFEAALSLPAPDPEPTHPGGPFATPDTPRD